VKKLRFAVSIPVGTAKAIRKNRPKMAVFLLLIASFRVKIGLKNSYAPRVRLSDIFVRTRDPDLALLLYKPKSVKEINFCISFFSTMEMIHFFNKP